MRRGITMIEILITLSLLAILTTVSITILNPAGQFADARNSQRELHLNAVANAIRQNMADTSGGAFTCASGPIPTSSLKMASGSGNYDIAPCLVPTYLPTMPFDPRAEGARYVSSGDYDSGYNIVRNASSGQVTVSAPAAELGKTISVTR